jgi:hypothetical protein
MTKIRIAQSTVSRNVNAMVEVTHANYIQPIAQSQNMINAFQ